MEPVTGDDAAKDDANLRGNGFAMGFSANIHMVNLSIGLIPPLLKEARRIYDLNAAPLGCTDCRDCPLVDELATIAGR